MSHFVWTGQSMLPNSENSPGSFAQQQPNLPVASLVPSDFWRPEAFARFWHPAVPATAVPKASVHEHGELPAAKNKIRLSRKLLISTPSSDPACSKNCDQFEFRFLVSLGLDCRHYLRALNLTEYIGHSVLFGQFGEYDRSLTLPDVHRRSHFGRHNPQKPFETLEKLWLNQQVNESPIPRGIRE